MRIPFEKIFGKVNLNETEESTNLPLIPSPCLSSILSCYCEKTEMFGSYLIEKQVLHYFSFYFSEILLEIYDKFLSQNLESKSGEMLNRETILQIIFDLKLIMDIFSGRSIVSEEIEQAIKEISEQKKTEKNEKNDFEEEKKNLHNKNNSPSFLPGSLLHKYNWKKSVETVLEKAHQKMDPIDVAYYQPLIFESVSNFLKKSFLLFAPLTSLYFTEEKSMLNNNNNNQNRDDFLNFIPVSCSKTKFSTLPIGSSQHYKKDSNNKSPSLPRGVYLPHDPSLSKSKPEEKKDISSALSFLQQVGKLNLFNRQK